MQDAAITLMIPMRNEEAFVGRCLDSILPQLDAFPGAEVLCIDGASTDRTRAIILEYQSRDARIRLIDNPRRIVPVALNLAIRESRGDILVRLDCHSTYAPDYAASCLDVLQRTGADNVGGCVKTLPRIQTATGLAIAAAMSSRFGVGGSAFRTGGGESEADTVPFGCFRRDVFERFGFFDERLERNQDIEFNSRLRRGGGRIVLSPSIRLTYFCPATYGGMIQQAFRNGLWNPYTIYLTGHGLGWRHFAPLSAVVFGLGLAVVGLVVPAMWLVLVVCILLYLLLDLVAAATEAARRGVSLARLVVAFPLLHAAYGLGSLWGILSAPVRFGWPAARRGDPREMVAAMPLAQAALKRALDVVVAAAGLAIGLVPMLAIGVAIRIASRGPVLFRQVRIGRGGRPFLCLKFRTMRVDANKSGSVTVKGDRRVTQIGRFLRATKLDELPQLWSVLTGRMSLVGPRPDVPGYADRLEGKDRRILELRPGITGPATLFFRNEEALLARSPDPVAYNDTVVYPAKVRLNLDYLDSWSLGKDIALLLVTACPPLDRWLKAIPRNVSLPEPDSRETKTTPSAQLKAETAEQTSLTA